MTEIFPRPVSSLEDNSPSLKGIRGLLDLRETKVLLFSPQLSQAIRLLPLSPVPVFLCGIWL
jgi:hypothetical protein